MLPGGIGLQKCGERLFDRKISRIANRENVMKTYHTTALRIHVNEASFVSGKTRELLLGDVRWKTNQDVVWEFAPVLKANSERPNLFRYKPLRPRIPRSTNSS